MSPALSLLVSVVYLLWVALAISAGNVALLIGALAAGYGLCLLPGRTKQKP